MSIIKEVREFFLRHNTVSSGNKRDREYGFPLEYLITVASKSIKVYNRFLKGDYPSESVFTKLFNSITFKLNPEDKAKLTEQGLVKIASDANATTGSDADVDGMTTVVVPHQLPIIKSDSDNVTITVDSGVTARNEYKVKVSAPSQLEPLVITLSPDDINNEINICTKIPSEYFK